MTSTLELAQLIKPAQTPANSIFASLARQLETEDAAHGRSNVLVVSADMLTLGQFSARLGALDHRELSVRTASSLEHVAAAIARDDFDVVIVDIGQGQQPEAYRSIERLGGPAIVVLGDDSQQAQVAFDLGAVDFVLRDADSRRLDRAIGRALAGIACTRQPSATHSATKRWIRAARGKELISAPLDQALYFQAERKQTRVVFPHVEAYLHLGINAVAAALNAHQFWRIHRGTIINAHCLKAVRRDELGRVKVSLQDCTAWLMVSKPCEHLVCSEGLF